MGDMDSLKSVSYTHLLGWLTVGAGRSVPVDFADLVAQSHAALEAKQ